ncbi:DUF4332 domain-containing protein [Roseiconus lacunae]|uniref:DUF4332 domain-containing protein n=1 Tax=Roseiconus lacunae TaxID=2605694 RepID=UPI001E5D56A7|nr:DUF4332 domain-containing protein [Roseiconus lacunae]MCD0462800.1 DUF4332 domain-containing protein [Roseiconus lacunae]
MLLDRIDIDTHGPLNRVELGPFSEGLNVVCTPEGSGKTALVRFIRDSLVRREYPLGMMSSSAGRVVWADRNGKIHCRREHDGTSTGRRTIEFETRGETAHRFDWLHGSWINGIADSNDASRALESIRIPEAIVDGVVTDTAVTNVSRVIAACLTAGLNDPALFAQLPRNASAISGLSPAETGDAEVARRAIRDELARVEAELATYPNTPTPDASAEARREQLRSRLSELYRHVQLDPHAGLPRYDDASYQASAEWNTLQQRIWQLRVRHGELVRWLDHLQADRNRIRYSSPVTSSPYASTQMPTSAGVSLSPSRIEIEARLRERLTEVDGQIIRWRQVLSELHSLRDVVLADHQRHALQQFARRAGALPLSDAMLQRERMRYLASSLDYFAGHPSVTPSQLHSWSEIAPSLANAWPDEIDLRLEGLIRRIESLDQYYGRHGRAAWSWYGDWTGHASLPLNWSRHQDTGLHGHLRALRDELAAARRHGFGFTNLRTELNELALADHRHREWMDLQATEKWIVGTIERLMVHRANLVRDHHQSDLVRYPSWLDQRYHQQSWSPWYTEHLQREIADRTVELQRTANELDRCVSRATDLRHSLRSLDMATTHPSGSSVAVEAEIRVIREELDAIERSKPVNEPARMTWLRRRKEELLEKLGAPQVNYHSAIPLADEASAWLVRLSGGRLRRVDWNPAEFTTGANNTGHAHLDGRDEATCPAIDRALAALAVRLAAGDLLARTGRAIPLVIEAHRELLQTPSTVAYGTNVAPASDLQGVSSNGFARGEGDPGELNFAVIAALNDYAKNGRQLIVLTSDVMFADQVSRRGGRFFQIHGERVAHEHRPVWRPHYSSETYVGPHAAAQAGSFLQGESIDPLQQSDVMIDQYYDEYFYGNPIGRSFADVNRNLDAIWQEAYGIAGYPSSPNSSDAAAGYGVNRSSQAPSYGPGQTDRLSQHSGTGHYNVYPSSGPLRTPVTHPADAPRRDTPGDFPGTDSGVAFGSHVGGPSHWNDGYYYSDSYTTAPTPRPNPHHAGQDQRRGGQSPASSQGSERPSASPFFLTIDSPIDQAPSVDAVAASRLRTLNVTHITHLMNQDPNRLSDALGLASVTAATIRRWQSECRLVCNVPQLRGFDARVLVGCGITDPGHLAATDPNDLLDRVEAFLATERGQRILLSGTSYELSRITSWIAAAGIQPLADPTLSDRRNGRSDRQTVDGRVIRQGRRSPSIGQRLDLNLDQDRYEYEFTDDHGRVVRSSSGRSRSSQSRSTRLNGRQSRSNGRVAGLRQSQQRESAPPQSEGHRRSSTSTSGLRSRRNGSSSHSVNGGGRSSRERSSRESGTRSSSRRLRSRRSDSSSSHRVRQERDYDRKVASQQNDQDELKFYLQRSSPIVDAPSIGSRMAERLEAIGIYTVDDLIQADPETVADSLDHRRIDADVIQIWQYQAILVCRIPMLRGHDAQLLVAADVTTPEAVADQDPDALFELINPIAKSNEGKRILRGGNLPDLEEIREWIGNAKLNRELAAAL